jgi:hypothetical protein
VETNLPTPCLAGLESNICEDNQQQEQHKCGYNKEKNTGILGQTNAKQLISCRQ